MDPNTTFDQGRTEGLPLAESTREWPGLKTAGEPAAEPQDVRFPGEDGGKSLAAMAERDLNATLQLLAERAQYITGATGAAIAVMDHGEMVCKASAGASAPEIGARLQIDSGLSGESIRTRETLRCDDIQTDGRVNRESCEELGIASVVVMPILEDEVVIGVFELFSNHPHAFQDRDIVALERMGFMVRTALAQAESAQMGSNEGGTPSAREREASAMPGDVTDADVAPSLRTESSAYPTAVEEEEDEIGVPPQQTAASLEENELIAEIRRFAREKGLTITPSKPETEESEEPATPERPKIAFHMRGSSPRRVDPMASAIDPGAAASAAPAIEGTKPAWVAPEVNRVPSEPPASSHEPAKPPVSAGPEVGVTQGVPQAKRVDIEERGHTTLTRTATEETVEATLVDETKPLPSSASTVSRGAAISPEPSLQVSADAGAQALISTEKTATATATAKSTLPATTDGVPAPTARSVEKARTAVAGLRRCEVCGFPVSEGRKFCIDCEKKKPVAATTAEVSDTQTAKPPADTAEAMPEPKPLLQPTAQTAQGDSPAPAAPQFLINTSDQYESWIVSHRYTVVAIAVVVVGVIVYLLSR